VSDFLTNLTARTIAAPSLRPRSRMRFEPAAAEPMAILPDVAHDEAPDARAPPALPPLKPPTHQPAPSATHTEREPPASPAPALQAEAGEPQQYAAPPATADRTDQPQIIPEPAAPPRIVGPAAAAPEQAAQTTVERVIEARAVPPIKRITINAETPPERPHRYDEQAPHIEPVAPAHEERRSETASDRRAPPQQPAATARPRTALFPMPPESTPAASEREAVVQVSIGRIEVRAVRPAAPPRTERANPIMTIEEYMARRKGRP
jgi:WAS/WASL-interacting protein